MATLTERRILGTLRAHPRAPAALWRRRRSTAVRHLLRLILLAAALPGCGQPTSAASGATPRCDDDAPRAGRPEGSPDPGPPPALAAATSLPPSAKPGSETLDDQPPFARRTFFKRVFTDQKYLVTTWWPMEFRRPTFYGPLLAATVLAAQDAGSGGSGNVDVELGYRVDTGSKGAETPSRTGSPSWATAP